MGLIHDLDQDNHREVWISNEGAGQITSQMRGKTRPSVRHVGLPNKAIDLGRIGKRCTWPQARPETLAIAQGTVGQGSSGGSCLRKDTVSIVLVVERQQ